MLSVYILRPLIEREVEECDAFISFRPDWVGFVVRTTYCRVGRVVEYLYSNRMTAELDIVLVRFGGLNPDPAVGGAVGTVDWRTFCEPNLAFVM